MNFINLPGRGRRLVSLPAAELAGTLLMAGYDPEIDATTVELPLADEDFSLLLLLPGKLNEFVTGGLTRIESQLTSATLLQLTKKMSLIPVDVKLPLINVQNLIELNQVIVYLALCKPRTYQIPH